MRPRHGGNLRDVFFRTRHGQERGGENQVILIDLEMTFAEAATLEAWLRRATDQ
jgi:hypothetical protein